MSQSRESLDTRTPAHPPGETPAHPPGETPAHPPGETPAHPPGETPAHPPGETPAHPPGETRHLNFAPSDPTDDRRPGEWKTRYPDAWSYISSEAWYVWIHLFACLAGLLLLTWYAPYNHSTESAVGQDGKPLNVSFGFYQILHAFLGGLLGGSIYSAKWLVHVVARKIWNRDRVLWRYFTPYVSAGLATAFVAMMGSGLVVVVNEESMRSVWVCFGLGFLVGYFSDNATAKLSELATTMFGSNRKIDPR